MRDLLSYILDKIIDAKLEVSEEKEDGVILLKIKAPSEYIGRIIGKNGKTINAIKNVLKIKAVKEGTRLDIEVLEA